MSAELRRVGPAPAGSGRPGGRAALPEAEVDLSVRFAGLELANPITTASGCFGSGREIDRFHDVTELGSIVVKSVTLEPRRGLPTPRMAETPSGMLNAIGLQNPGVDAWLAEDLPWLVERGATVIVSVAGKSVGEYREVARRLKRQSGIAALEVNLSCPNVEHRGLVFACSADASSEVIGAVRREADVPVLAKLTSDVTDIVEVASAVMDAGADGLTLINTLLGMAIDAESGRPALYNGSGGLSGPAIRPVAVRNVHQVHQAMPEVPIIGCGGVRSVTDAVEMIRAGATLVAVGTASFVDPFTAFDLIAELRRWLAERGVRAVSELRGAVTPW